MIADASIDTAKINNLTVDFATVTGVLTANQIAAISISADRITSGTIDADRIDAALLNVANMFLSGTLNVNNTNGAIAWGKTSGDVPWQLPVLCIARRFHSNRTSLHIA